MSTPDMLDDLLSDIEKKEQVSAQKRANGFDAIDWAAIDPDNIEPALIKRFANSVAAKRWAKATGKGPLSDDQTTAYILFTREKHVQGRKALQDKALDVLAEREATKIANKAELERRLAVYISLKTAPQPHDVVNYRQLCVIEIDMEQIWEARNLIPPTSEANMKLRAMMTAEYQALATNYRDFQKILGISKTQRDASRQEQSAADIVGDTIDRSARWMEEELLIGLCPNCKTEILWLWWAYARVHDARPYYFTGICACGSRYEVGDRSLIERTAA